MNIAIRNGRVIDPKDSFDRVTDIYIRSGKIASLGDAPPGFEVRREINALGLIVCAGLVDLSARLREPGLEYKATLQSEMGAAVAGGDPSQDPFAVHAETPRGTEDRAHHRPPRASPVALRGETRMSRRDAGAARPHRTGGRLRR